MKNRDIKKLIRGIETFPIRLRKLYWRRWFKVRPVEASRAEHSRWSRGKLGKRFYGQAWHDGSKIIDLDVGVCLMDKQPLSQACETIIHEVCHIVFNTHHVSKLVKQAKRRIIVWDATEKRLAKLLVKKSLR